MKQCILIVEDDPGIGNGLVLGLEREERTVILCRDLESAQLVIEQATVTHIVSDVKLTGPFRFEGLDFIDHAKRHAPSVGVILMTGAPSDELEAEAAHRGAVAFLRKPFDLASLETLLRRPHAGPPPGDGPAVLRIPTIDEILESGALYPHFQPIVKLGESIASFGFESLARFRTDSFLSRPELLFDYAWRKKRIVDLELACITETFRRGKALTDRGLLFLNLHPVVFQSPERLVSGVVDAARENAIPLDRVILEITEQQSLGDRHIVLQSIHALEREGIRFAFDDLGIAYSHLTLIDDIRPAFLKISQHFGTGFEQDPTKQKIVRNVLSLAREFSCQLIIEGIEEEASSRHARELGIPLGQGYHFGRPAEAASFG